MKRFLDWLDRRTGCKEVTQEALFERIPGGSRWRYVWGSTLVFALLVQFITGVFLWMAYSPSSNTAWESVYYIQYEMTGGAWLRGLHHFTAQAMIVLLVLHLMQVVIDGAYRAPREVNFWFGLVLLLLVLALSLTGYLLPWDQKGYWATKVTTNIIGITPLIGPFLQKLIIGGPDYGHFTLTRFFALHAGVLPGLIIVMLAAHIYLFRRHGITAKRPLRKPDQYFWPDQVLKDAVACLAVLAAVLFFILRPQLFGDGHFGADLGAPADPSEAYSAARPEWYFLFLFEFLKYFPGEKEIWGALVIPGLVLGVIFLMPIIGQWKLGHGFNVGFLSVILVGAGLLTFRAISQDNNDPHYQAAVKESARSADRIKTLAKVTGIPGEGALALLRTDPLTQGPRIFAKNCAACHRYDGHDGTGVTPKDDQTAPDLKGFATREWVAGFLDPERIVSVHYFLGTKFKNGKMVRFVKGDLDDPSLKPKVDRIVMALSAEADLKSQDEIDRRDAALISEGRKLIASEDMRCTECHQYHQQNEDPSAPDLTNYGSRDWLIEFLSNPAHPRFYGTRNDRMPSFGKEGRLNPQEVALVADWLRGEWQEAEAGKATSAQ